MRILVAGIIGLAGTAVAAQQPAVNISELLARAAQFREDGDYQEAERVLETILRASPRNKDATAMLNKIRRGRDVEQK